MTEGGRKKRGWFWREDEGPETYRFTAAGAPITCDQCGNDEFLPGRAQLNTVGLTFLGLDWANQSAYTLMCSQCGRIEWYGLEPEAVL